MRRTRSRCPSAATMLSAPLAWLPVMVMVMGNDAGQMSSIFLTGVAYVHQSRRFRRCVDANTIPRHRRQTCTSLAHPKEMSSV
ncbi:hypothetical protein BC826DRAFT_1025279 [Russula brevipes]|nr:hypothetical protein BC826DRAFT_1025279 [Russula brevipes]